MPPLLTKPIHVAVIGSGGREHALAWKIAQSPYCKKVTVIPGNGGMAMAGVSCYAPDKKLTLAEKIKAVTEIGATFVVVGPDDDLAAGIVDQLTSQGIVVFGPTKKAAKLEWSKAFAKEIMQAAQVHTARCQQWGSLDEAMTSLSGVAKDYGGYPLVLKYDGLALGKGVRICENESQAKAFLQDVYESGVFGTSKQVICEEYLIGHEMSVFALCDGENALLLDTACDHKRLLDGNAGPNTGGMGAYSPTTWFPREKLNMLKEQIFLPVLREMATRGTPFRGLLYAGLMVRGNDYWVLEFNARFGDPETQALLPRLQSDLLPLLYACAVGDLQRGLDMVAVQWSPQASVAVVLASEGYPEKPILGRPVTVATEPDFTAEKTDEKSVLNADEAQLFFAGAGQNQNSSDGLLHTTGGRVAAVQALAPTLELARGRVYAELSRISFPGMIYRKDIGSYNG